MKLRIFVIDDEESIRDTFKLHLEGQGHEVLTAPEPVLGVRLRVSMKHGAIHSFSTTLLCS